MIINDKMETRQDRYNALKQYLLVWDINGVKEVLYGKHDMLAQTNMQLDIYPRYGTKWQELVERKDELLEQIHVIQKHVDYMSEVDNKAEKRLHAMTEYNFMGDKYPMTYEQYFKLREYDRLESINNRHYKSTKWCNNFRGMLVGGIV